MPRPVVPPTLYTLALRNNAQMLYQGLRAVDQLWEPPKMTLNAPRSSPSGSPHNLSTSQLFLAPLSSEEEQEEQQRLNMVQLIRDWLMQTPTLVMEDLIA
eukprot:TCALIF_12678-PA protein Name:"Protein of unknown function" AED:0.00 eAED:0.00 QI:86/1/0.5/1/1/0.5/2/0/99